jgi:hypothetical protein
MSRPTSVLVVANQTADSPELVRALQARAQQGPVRLTLLMPCTGPGLHARDAARPRLDAALAVWREAGLEAEGVVGDEDALEAVHEVWNPREHDEIVVSTLPGPQSRWLRCDLPNRLTRMTDAHVTHVRSSAPAPRPEPVAAGRPRRAGEGDHDVLDTIGRVAVDGGRLVGRVQRR